MPDSWYNVRDSQNSIELSIEDFDVNSNKDFTVYGFKRYEQSLRPCSLSRVDGEWQSTIEYPFGSSLAAEYSTVKIVGHVSQFKDWVKNAENSIAMEILNVPHERKYLEYEMTKPFDAYYNSKNWLPAWQQYEYTYYRADDVLVYYHITYLMMIGGRRLYEIKNVDINADGERRKALQNAASDPQNTKYVLACFQYRVEPLVRRTTLPPGHYATENIFMGAVQDTLNNNFKTMLDESSASSKIQALFDRSKSLMFELSGHDGSKVSKLHLSNLVLEAHLKVRLHPTLQFQLGLVDYLSDDLGWVDRVEVWGKHPCDMSRNTLRSMYVFCDIIEPNMVCDRLIPLLRFMSVDASSHQISYEAFGRLIPRLVNKTSVLNIRVWFSEFWHGQTSLALSADTVVRLQF